MLTFDLRMQLDVLIEVLREDPDVLTLQALAGEVVRAALYRYIAERKSDPHFQARLRELLEKDREVIERLAAGLAA